MDECLRRGAIATETGDSAESWTQCRNGVVAGREGHIQGSKPESNPRSNTKQKTKAKEHYIDHEP